jgi:hypothetical protein
MSARLSLVLLAVLTAAPAIAAKNYIAGRVIDRNGDPIDKAVITLRPQTDKGLQAQLVTDREGRFLIDYLRDPAGERAKLARRSEYAVEVYKPGFHLRNVSVIYRKGELQVDTLMLTEDTIVVHDDDVQLDPDAYDQSTHAAGANYEGQ